MTVKEKIIEQRCYVGSPNDYIVYTEIFKLCENKKEFLLKIKFDTDDWNSFGLLVKVLNPNNSWETLYSVPMKQTILKKLSPFKYEKCPEKALPEFTEDVKACKKVVESMLF